MPLEVIVVVVVLAGEALAVVVQRVHAVAVGLAAGLGVRVDDAL